MYEPFIFFHKRGKKTILERMVHTLEATRTGRLPAPPTLLLVQAEAEGEAIHEAAIM